MILNVGSEENGEHPISFELIFSKSTRSLLSVTYSLYCSDVEYDRLVNSCIAALYCSDIEVGMVQRAISSRHSLLSKVIHCNCLNSCKTLRCSCRNNGLPRTSACGPCQLTICNNPHNKIPLKEHSDEDNQRVIE